MAIQRDEVVSQLAVVIGDERAEEIVAETLAELGLTGWSDAIAERVVDQLVATRGLIGAAARRLRSAALPVGSVAPRARTAPMTTPTSGIAAHRSSAAGVARPATPASGVRASEDAHTESVTFSKLTAMLGASLGESKARGLVEDAARRRGISRESFSVDDAFLVLEDLTREAGLVGTVARFAKARAHFELA